MAEIIIIRLLYSLYFGVCIYVILNALSEFAFSPKRDVKRTLFRLVISPFWLLAVFSPSGRKFLFNFYGKGL